MNRAVFSEQSFILVSSHHTYGVQHALYTYLREKKAKQAYLLNHPLHGVATDLTTTLESFPSKKKAVRIKRARLPEWLNYAIDFYWTVRLVSALPDPVDVYIGFNSLHALAGVVLKKLGRVKYVVNYSHSYKTVRYTNPVLNALYQWIDALAIRQSDSLWGLGKALSHIRKQQGMPAGKIVEVADGVDLDIVKPKPYAAFRRSKLVFVGLINPINGLDVVIQAMPALRRWRSDMTLDVIGTGEDLAKIKDEVASLGLNRSVKFFGIESIEQLGRHLPECGIGFATYQPLPNSTLKTTDPMKTKLYMAAGLPIVSTDIYASAHEIADEKLGVLVPYDPDAVVAAVKKIFAEDTYKRMRTNGIRAAKKYDWDVIFDHAFEASVARKGSV